MAAMLVLHDKIIKPLLAAATQKKRSRRAQKPTAIDRHYEVIRTEMRGLLQAAWIGCIVFSTNLFVDVGSKRLRHLRFQDRARRPIQGARNRRAA
jgi:hypothetical protein